MTKFPTTTVYRPCSGCGAWIEYTIATRSDEVGPELNFPSLIAYAGGHLCHGCIPDVQAVLYKRRRERLDQSHPPEGCD